ncbi:MAG TPA: hypothetical protein VJ385_03155 [Fibrobacteria bacterium]|nr:hypothetical protein [Fibrobacteria bacterium]
METESARGIGRREFIGAAAAALFAGVVIQITGCGTDDDGGDDASADGSATGSISDNHPAPHKAVVTKAQIDAGGAVSLDIQGSANHSHTVQLSAADMATLKARNHVMATSTSGGADPHTHMVMFN